MIWLAIQGDVNWQSYKVGEGGNDVIPVLKAIIQNWELTEKIKIMLWCEFVLHSKIPPRA
jgi:hypothetical protein